MRTPEGHEKAKIRKYLDSIGAWHCCPYMAGYGKAGVPDILACIDGRFWGIEVKREGKKATPLQSRRMAEILEAYGMVTCGTAEKVISDLAGWSRRIRDN